MTGRPWDALTAELDAWQAAGREATLWWRDDDASRPTPALDRLIELSAGAAVPLGLAVVPAGTAPDLPSALGAAPVTVLQHGYAHVNHASRLAKKCELGNNRPLNTVCAELEQGRADLAARFGAGFLPVMVPPWNRISAKVANRLKAMGFIGLSTFGPRGEPVDPDLVRVNTHVDLINWRGTRGFVGDAAALGALTRHLANRRTGAVDGAEATGILSHHLDHDAGCWTFLEALFAATAEHPAVRWLDPPSAFGAAGPSRPGGGPS